ncbi:hypothetical protein [Nocardia wallacei]|uniref:hypothetical protein n=1 Tax=Nocardia wallacei TaxID=480035 RepID=UPI002456CF1E|nr:hypothetical protein [Nocardia wallacei]
MKNITHECRARKCRARTRDEDGRWHPAGTERPDSLCVSCEKATFSAIRQLDSDFAALDEAATDSTTQGNCLESKVTKSRGRPVPVNVGLLALAAEIDDEVMTWALRADHALDELPRNQWQRVHTCVTSLRTHLGTLVDLPPQDVCVFEPDEHGDDQAVTKALDGVDAVQRLARLHHRAQDALGLPEKVAWLQSPCHLCGLKALTHGEEDDIVTCRNCCAVWTLDEYNWTAGLEDAA